MSKEEKVKLGHEAIEIVLANLVNTNEIKKLILEFDEHKTNEAIFAYYCDKLECDIQCKLYDEENCVDINNQLSNKIYHNEEIQRLKSNGEQSWSDMWLEYDRYIYKDKNFIELLNYIKNNKIS